MLNVLINAYAISPNWGSEQGVGWNWIIHIAKFCNCYVITESEYEKEIQEAVEQLPQKKNLHFYFNPVTPEVRKMCWNQGDYRFYYYYEKWQRRTLKLAYEICSKVHIDVLHQQNMVGFREPGYLWKIKEIPFVWGPVCGMEDVPLRMLPNLTLVQQFKYLLKNAVSSWQRKHQGRVVKAIRRSAVIMPATRNTYETLRNYHHVDNLVFINETGTEVGIKQHIVHDYNHEGLNLMWVGRFLDTKKLDLALETLALLKGSPIHLDVVGTGSDEEVQYYKTYAKVLGISNMITWWGKVPNVEVKKMMQKSDLFFMTSVVEATSTVVPEAITNNLPVLSFNACGFGHLVKNRVGETIEMTTPKQAAKEFAEKIQYLFSHRDVLAHYSEACEKYKNELSWQWKAERCVEMYQRAISNFKKEGI